MIGHLGSHISALLDGQLSAEEEERAWAHVHVCHLCRDQVEREGWVKTRLAGLTHDPSGIPDRLKGHLLGSLSGSPIGLPPGDTYLALSAPSDHRPRRVAGLAAIGGGALGAAVVGVLALGAAPADAPSIDRRPPVTQISPPQSPAPTPGVPLRTR
ncbi:anti-sigma factor family protein [Nocardioides ferulae]|uniref:anti-sigma factor family protein n=1 Tax=Nocardioides ferulae TaxID=2340821 RepID=UPI000EB02E3E|nr:hypothetical protein [Nocardioides ferulae]